MCKEFKDKSNKIIKETAAEKEMISEEFFKKVMGNSPFPDIVNETALPNKQKWKFDMVTLTMADMTKALNDLDEGYVSIPQMFVSFDSMNKEDI